MDKFAIIGGGALGEQLYLFLSQTSTDASFFFFDDILFEQKHENALPFKEYTSNHFVDYTFCIGLGYRHLNKKKEIGQELTALNRNQATFIHPTCFINHTASIGKGSFVYPLANIDKEVRIGTGNLINNSVVISHNATIGDSCYLSPSVVICGQVEIGECTFIGAGAVISNGVKIGKNVVIGIGSVVTKDIPDNSSVVGNPAKILNKQLMIK